MKLLSCRFGTQKTNDNKVNRKVDSKELAKAQSGNIVQSLSGEVAGVQITTNSEGNRRCAKCVRGGFRYLTIEQPLYVDGIPFGGSINSLQAIAMVESVVF